MAILRSITGLRVEEMARLISLSVSTLRKVEAGIKGAQDSTAVRVEAATGVSADWLSMPPDVPPFTPSGEPFTKEIFEATRAARFRGVNIRSMIDEASSRLAQIGRRAARNGKSALMAFKVSRLVDDIDRQFGSVAKAADSAKGAR